MWTCVLSTAVIPSESGESSTPRLLGFGIAASGILGRPVKPGDDTEVVLRGEDRFAGNDDDAV